MVIKFHARRNAVGSLEYGMLLHVRPNLESCHVIDRHAKVVLAVYVLPAELNHVLAVAGNQTLCGRGYGMLFGDFPDGDAVCEAP